MFPCLTTLRQSIPVLLVDIEHHDSLENMHSEDSQNVVKFTTRFWKTYFQSFLWLSLQTMNSTHCPMKRVRCNKLREKRICHLVDGSFVCTFLFRKQDTFFSEKVLYNTVQYSTVHLVTVYLRPSLQMVRIQNGPQFAWNVREWTLCSRGPQPFRRCVFEEMYKSNIILLATVRVDYTRQSSEQHPCST